MARENGSGSNGSSKTAIVAIIVIILVLAAIVYFWRSSDKGRNVNQTTIESPVQTPPGSGAERTQRYSGDSQRR